jgi:T5orf172 domain
MKTYPGFVYILSNPVFKDDIFKIGHTTRSPSDRAWEIYQNATGVPAKFEVAYARQVANCEQAEQRIHDILNEVRINEYREFFRVSLFQAKEVFEEVCVQVDLECKDTQAISRKTVIDCIGTRENPKAAVISNATQNQAVAQNVTRIRRENDFKKAAQLTRVVSEVPTSKENCPLWLVSFQWVLVFLGLFLYMKYLVLPVARELGIALGNFVGGLFLTSAPLIYVFVMSRIFPGKK